MELGGKSPLIVCTDADLEATADALVRQYRNAGQVCLAGTRVLVEESVADSFLERVRERIKYIVVGDPRDAKTHVGPLITPEHFERVEGFVERAKRDGAVPLWGGGRSNAGRLFFQPTMFSRVSSQMEIAQSEVFGPVLTWQTFATDEDAVTLANNTAYGLSASLFSRHEERAMRMAEQITAGTVWVNCFFIRELSAPFGAKKQRHRSGRRHP